MSDSETWDDTTPHDELALAAVPAGGISTVSSGHDLSRVTSSNDLFAGQAPINPTAVFSGYNPTFQRLDGYADRLLDMRPAGGGQFLRPFRFLNDIHAYPALAAATFTATGWGVYTEPFGSAIGGCMVGVGVLALASPAIAQILALKNRISSEDIDAFLTRGSALAGIGLIAGGAAAAAGPSWVSVMAAVPELVAAYVGWHQWRHHKLSKQRDFLVDYAEATRAAPVPHSGTSVPVQGQIVPGTPVSPYEARLRHAFSEIKIEGVWFGSPMRVADETWSAPFDLPSGANLSPATLAKKVGVIANNMKARRVDIRPTHGSQGVITVYDGPDRTYETYPWTETKPRSIRSPVLLGYDECARQARLTAVGRILIAGAAGYGKSQMLNSLLLTTLPCQDLVRIGIDCKPGAPELGPYELVMHYLATDARQAMAVLYGNREVIKERGLILAENSIPQVPDESGVPVRKWRSEFGPRIVTVTDEIAELTRWEPGAAKLMESNRQLGRFVEVDVWDATQSPSAKAMGGDTDARQQYDIRIGFQTEGVVDNILFGQGASGRGWKLELLEVIGQFLISSQEFTKPQVLKGLYSTDQDVADQVAKWAPHVASMDQRSAEAFMRGVQAYLEGNLESLGPDGPGGGMPAESETTVRPSGPPTLRLLPNYPDSDEPIELKHQAMWDLLGQFGTDGALAKDLAAKRLPSFTSPSNTLALLRYWEGRGYVLAAKDGRGDRFVRVDMVPRGSRREA